MASGGFWMARNNVILINKQHIFTTLIKAEMEWTQKSVTWAEWTSCKLLLGNGILKTMFILLNKDRAK